MLDRLARERLRHDGPPVVTRRNRYTATVRRRPRTAIRLAGAAWRIRRLALVERSDVHRLSAVTAAFEVVPTLAFMLPAMAKGPSPETAHMRRRHRAILGRLAHTRLRPIAASATPHGGGSYDACSPSCACPRDARAAPALVGARRSEQGQFERGLMRREQGGDERGAGAPTVLERQPAASIADYEDRPSFAAQHRVRLVEDDRPRCASSARFTSAAAHGLFVEA